MLLEHNVFKTFIYDTLEILNTRYKVSEKLKLPIQNIISGKYTTDEIQFITENNLETVFNDIHCVYVSYINDTDATIQITTIKNRLNELFYQLSLSN
jgi:hypothetical protein